MKRLLKKAAALCLAAAMILGMTAIDASAASKKKTLVCIGDSIAAGYGLTEDLSLNLQDVTIEDFLTSGLTFYGQNPATAAKDKYVNAYPRQVADRAGYEYGNL